MIEIGLKQTSELTVTETVTAIRVGSGDMPVLATQMLLALMENAAMLAVKDELPEGCTTVGGHIASSHLKPSKIGDVVRAETEVTKVNGKKIEFKVSAYSGGILLGEGTHLRLSRIGVVNLLAGIAAYAFYDTKPSINMEFEREEKQGVKQLTLF